MIKILHIYRGYGSDLKNTVVDNQITSLEKIASVEIFSYVIKKGGLEYLRSIKNIRALIKKKQIDVIHAHYSFSGFVAGLAFTGKPVVCSLMGSDVLSSPVERKILSAFKKLLSAFVTTSTASPSNISGAISKSLLKTENVVDA